MAHKKILVVEDERSLSSVIKQKLEQASFEVLLAASVQEAKEHVNQTSSLDAIWLDHYLIGQENGLDFVAWCRTEHSECQDTPIFVVTNTGGDEKKATYLSLGASRYFIKSDNRLDEIVQDVLREVTK